MHADDTSTSAGRARPTGRMPRPDVDLSVALCTWNGARWVRSFLDSLAEQELLPDELVVSDDRSDDDTVAIIEDFAASSPFPVHLQVNEQRLGSTANFARVLERCRGRFIALADQDDLWYPAKLRRLRDELAADPTLTLAFSDADLIGEDGRSLQRRLWDTRLVGRTLRKHPIVPEELFARRPLTTGCTMVIRRRAAEAALPFPEDLTDEVAPMRHDRWLSLVAAAVGSVRAVPEPLLGFRVHPAQETGVLAGPQLSAALRRAAAAVVVDRSPEHSRGLRARAAQLQAAAERADLLGDFGEARTLREVAEGQLLRARLDEPGPGRFRMLVRAVRGGVYTPDPMAVGAVLADLVRVLTRSVPMQLPARAEPT